MSHDDFPPQIAASSEDIRACFGHLMTEIDADYQHALETRPSLERNPKLLESLVRARTREAGHAMVEGLSEWKAETFFSVMAQAFAHYFGHADVEHSLEAA